jgi:hypothetical protein
MSRLPSLAIDAEAEALARMQDGHAREDVREDILSLQFKLQQKSAELIIFYTHKFILKQRVVREKRNDLFAKRKQPWN